MSLTTDRPVDPIQVWHNWNSFKDNRHLSPFIPIDPQLGHNPSAEKVVDYIEKTTNFILLCPRNVSISGQDSALCHQLNNFEADCELTYRLSRMAKIRKKEDLIAIRSRVSLSLESPDSYAKILVLWLQKTNPGFFSIPTLNRLETLNLSKTYIATFPARLCSHLGKVRALDLSCNALENTPLRFLGNLFQLPSLKHVNLSYNSFSADDWARITALLPLFKEIESINLRATHLKNAPSEFFDALLNLPLLKNLNVSGNELSTDLILSLLKGRAQNEISVRS